MPGRSQECCDDTPECVYCADAFSRPNGTDITTGSKCGWTEVAGSWSITDEALTTASSSALAIANKKQPEADAAQGHSVRVKVWGDSVSDVAKVIVDYLDGSNYYYCQFGFNGTSSSITLHTAGGAVLKTITGEATLAAGEWLQAEVWLSDGKLTAEIAGQQISTFADLRRPPAGEDGPQVGVGTGSVSSTVRFDNFQFNCGGTGSIPPGGPCAVCDGGLFPGVGILTIHGFEVSGDFKTDFPDVFNCQCTRVNMSLLLDHPEFCGLSTTLPFNPVCIPSMLGLSGFVKAASDSDPGILNYSAELHIAYSNFLGRGRYVLLFSGATTLGSPGSRDCSQPVSMIFVGMGFADPTASRNFVRICRPDLGSPGATWTPITE